jgi:hypothetical protein
MTVTYIIIQHENLLAQIWGGTKRLPRPVSSQLSGDRPPINRAMGVSFCPPLIITTEEIHEMFDMVAVALEKTEAWVHGEGLRAG